MLANGDSGMLGAEIIKVKNPVCCICHNGSTIRVPRAGFRKWQNGGLIQECLPTLTDDEREMLMTGIHPFCWDGMWDEDELDESDKDDD